MTDSEQISRTVSEFHGIQTPESLRPAGYAALLDRYQLKVPLPRVLAGIATLLRSPELRAGLLGARDGHEALRILRAHAGPSRR